jgi:hypothetical protein
VSHDNGALVVTVNNSRKKVHLEPTKQSLNPQYNFSNKLTKAKRHYKLQLFIAVNPCNNNSNTDNLSNNIPVPKIPPSSIYVVRSD